MSHQKPNYVFHALESIIRQTHDNFTLHVYDSGNLESELRRYLYHRPLLYILKITPIDIENEYKEKKLNMASWCFNDFLRILIENQNHDNELVVYLCDDDILYPTYFEEIAKAHFENQDHHCFYSEQDIIRIINETNYLIGIRKTNGVAGSAAGGSRLDCAVDYLQFSHTIHAIKKYQETYKESIHSIRSEDRWHADGIFMEKMGALFPVYPIPKVLSANRRTELSVNIK